MQQDEKSKLNFVLIGAQEILLSNCYPKKMTQGLIHAYMSKTDRQILKEDGR